ncbi:hypothetical protein LTR53_007878 [Teratosphaeriaceae sp. CCFEE 6253]|nr:hypothetical protein LTR53_007878 [Teratosphaeriaceae sp. CCFEE 6253]
MSLFNRPAWATTQASEDDESSRNIFSHSSHSYAEIVAEEQRTKRAREQKEREKKQRKERRISARREAEAEEKRQQSASPKRRRITLEEGDGLLSSIGLSPGLVERRSRQEDEDEVEEWTRTRSPRVKKTVDKSDTRVKSTKRAMEPAVVELRDSPEPEVVFSHAQPVEPVEHESDDEFAELARQARARRKPREESLKKSHTPILNSPAPGEDAVDTSRTAYSVPPPPDPPVRLLITSRMEGTKQLLVYRKLSQRLKEIREVWCDKQGFSKDFADKVYLTHRMRRVFDVTTCRSLGLSADAEGNITMKGHEGMEGADQVHLEAVTDELFAQIKAGKESEERIKRGLPSPEEEEVQAGASEAEPEEQLIRIYLTSKDRREPYKLRVKSSTLVSRIVTACAPQFNVEEGQTMSLDFDGERLQPDQTIGDTEIGDMDRIDVYIT